MQNFFRGNIAQNVAQTIIWSIYTHNFFWEKNEAKNWATSKNFPKLPKVNNGPMGESSPNLVTLHVVDNVGCSIFLKFRQLRRLNNLA
jgi:hypothetical protein